MKFKKLEWHDVRDEWHTTLYGEGVGWATAIIFKARGDWHLHFDCRDESEHIFTGHSKRATMDFAQEFHNKSVMEEFFDA